jgi:hypothetical protein
MYLTKRSKIRFLTVALGLGYVFVAAQGHADERSNITKRLSCLECTTSAVGCLNGECDKAKVRMPDGSDVDVQSLIDEVERTRPLVKGFRAIIAQQKKTIDELKAKVRSCRK